MKTIGELLQSHREKQGLTIAQVANATKIQAKFIEALEANRFADLPQATFVKGFIRNYAQVVGRDPQTLLAIFRRDYGQDAQGKVVPRGMVEPVGQPRLRWTPTATMIAGLTIILTIFITYLIIQFRSLSGIPNLEVTTPKEGETTTTLVTVEGTTNPQATLTINHQQVAIDQSGKFTSTISLQKGEHTVTIEAISRTGKSKLIQRTVNVQ